MTAKMTICAAAFAFVGGGVLAQDSATADFEITGDAEKGAKVFRKCKACHMVGADAKNRVGPALNGVVGGQIAAVADYSYSKGMAALGAEGKIWTPDELAAFLTKPKDYLKKTKMAFAGLRKQADRDNVIAYLASFDADGNSAE